MSFPKEVCNSVQGCVPTFARATYVEEAVRMQVDKSLEDLPNNGLDFVLGQGAAVDVAFPTFT